MPLQTRISFEFAFEFAFEPTREIEKLLAVGLRDLLLESFKPASGSSESTGMRVYRVNGLDERGHVSVIKYT